MREWFGWASND